MKYLMMVALALCVTSTVQAQTMPSRFDSSGFGRVFYEPDAYDLSFGITTEDRDIQKCKEVHIAAARKTKAVLDGRRDSIISLKQEATQLSLEPREEIWREDPENPERTVKRIVKHYVFRTIYTVRIKDPSSLVELQEGLITAGVTDVYGLDTFCEKLPELLGQARRQAIQDAKAKAELLATELGWTLSGPLSISIEDGEALRNRKASQEYDSRGYVYQPDQRQEFTNYVSSRVSIQFGYVSAK